MYSQQSWIQGDSLFNEVLTVSGNQNTLPNRVEIVLCILGHATQLVDSTCHQFHVTEVAYKSQPQLVELVDTECNHTLLKMRILAFLPISPCSST